MLIVNNSKEAEDIFHTEKSLSKALKVGFPYYDKILYLLKKKLGCPLWVIEEAIQEAWIELLEDSTKVEYLLGYLLSHVMNRARNILAKERRLKRVRKELSVL